MALLLCFRHTMLQMGCVRGAIVSDEQWYWFTFGYGQEYGPWGYAKFFGTYSSARQQMHDHFGDKWSFQYGSAEDAGVEQYNLKEVTYESKDNETSGL